MIQFSILSGKLAGTQWVARHFPVRVGRSAANDLRLEDSGVWDSHFELGFDPAEGFLLTAQPNAAITVNRQPVQTALLKSGDSIEIGSVQLQFGLPATGQRGLRLREWFVWSLLFGILALEIFLIYSLIR